MQTGHNKDNLSFIFWVLLLFFAFWKALKKRKRAKKEFVVLLMLEQWFLRHEVSLSEEKMATAATGLSLRTLVASTFNRESRLGPKAMLMDYLFRSLKPPQIMGVVIWEIKGLQFLGQGINPIMHAWPVWMECPGALWILGVHHRHRYSKIELKDSLLTIFLVEMASTARFRWLGALSNTKSPLARPFHQENVNRLIWS